MNPIISAASGRNTANTGPSKAYVAAMLSTPVCGVEGRNASDAALLAPCLRNDVVTGITLHEHSGSGTPNSDALNTGHNPRPPRCRSTVCGEMKTYRMPCKQEAEQQVRRHLAQRRPEGRQPWSRVNVVIVVACSFMWPERVPDPTLRDWHLLYTARSRVFRMFPTAPATAATNSRRSSRVSPSRRMPSRVSAKSYFTGSSAQSCGRTP